jgi:hypothetical protein
VSGTTVTLLTVGTCTIAANQAGDTTYAAAPTVTQSFAVLQSQTISFSSPGNQSVGGPLTLAATSNSGLPVTYTSLTPTVCTVSGNTVNLLGAGTCTITANQSGNGTYGSASTVTQSFTVAAAATPTKKVPFMPLWALLMAAGAMSVTAARRRRVDGGQA